MAGKQIQGYKIISLNEMLKNLEEERVLKILSSFSSPLNNDVEIFLRHKAVEKVLSASVSCRRNYRKNIV